MILLRFIPLKGQGLDICNRLEVVWFDRSTFFNKKVIHRLTPNAFELTKYFFQNWECVHHFLLNFHPFLPIGRQASQISSKLFLEGASERLSLFKRNLCKS
jgi:hypothetical protein